MTGSDVTIRPRAEDDLPTAIEALRVVARADCYPSRWPDDPAAWLRTGQPYGAWVAVRGGEILGHAVLRRPHGMTPVGLWCAGSGEDPESCSVLARLFVVPGARRLGLGRALVEAAWTSADELGLRLLLDVVDHNDAAVRLYHRLGWTMTGTYEQRFDDDGPMEVLHCFAAPRPGERRMPP